MPVRAPPGRAGRLWLLRRLEVARHGADVLDRKRQTLLRERQRLAGLLAGAEAEWERLAAEAAEWNARSAAIAGERCLRLAALHRGGATQVRVRWRNALGIAVPVEAGIDPAAAPDAVALGGGASVALSARAHERALAAAAAYAAARTAHDAVAAELASTTRRLRAIERRWIPEHEAELARLELILDESERDDIARARWAVERQHADTEAR